jgi:hypothetical protein
METVKKEIMWWAEQMVTGRVIFPVSRASRLPVGYELKSTTTPSEMDRVFKKMGEQEYGANAKRIQAIFNNGREYVIAARRRLRDRSCAHDCSNSEKALIHYILDLMDKKDAKMQENHAFGVSAMQESAAPLPPSTSHFRTASEIRAEKLAAHESNGKFIDLRSATEEN